MTAALLLVLGCGADPTRDADGDGFPASEDCDDRDAGVHPGAEDAPDDGLDGDCDGYDLGSEPLRGFERIEPDVATAHLQLGYDLRLGDVDGDGVDDLLAGSRESYATSEDFVAERGEAWLFAGGTLAPRSRWTGTRGPQLLGETLAIVQGQAGPQLALEALEGVWVLPADAGRGYPGDVGGVRLDNDGDGYAAGHGLDAMDLLGTPDEDLVVGCARDNPEHQSAVCIHEGPVTADALVGDAAAIVDGPGGRWLAGGDFDGDGARDLGVSDDETDESRGRVSVVAGPVAPGQYGAEIVEHQWDGELPDDWFGRRLAAGDLDGDGRDELVATAVGWANRSGRGRLYALTPAVGDVRDAPLLVDGDPTAPTLTTPLGWQALGQGVAVADLDEDGAADLAVGSPGLAVYDPTVRGRVLVFYGPVSGHLSSADAGRVFSGASPGDQAGFTVRAGEVTGDGVVDLVVAAPLASGVQPEMGQLYVLPGPLLPGG